MCSGPVESSGLEGKLPRGLAPIELLIRGISGVLIVRLWVDTSWTVARVLQALTDAAPLPVGAEYQLVMGSRILRSEEFLVTGSGSGSWADPPGNGGALRSNCSVCALTACVTQPPFGDFFLDSCHVEGHTDVFAAKLKLSPEGQAALVLHSHWKEGSSNCDMNVFVHPGKWEQEEDTSHIFIKPYSLEFQIAPGGDLRLLSNGSLTMRAVGDVFQRGNEEMRDGHAGGSKLWTHLVEASISKGASQPRATANHRA